MKLKTDQVGRAGESFVAAEILRRGGYAVTFSGNMPGIDILASDAEHLRTITLQVKTRTTGDWQTSSTRGRLWAGDPGDDRFWALVDLSAEHPVYFLLPAYWIENDIKSTDDAFRALHVPRVSTHHAIKTARVEQWRDRWDVLGILPATGG